MVYSGLMNTLTKIRYNINPNLLYTMRGQRQKDIIFSDGIRESFLFDSTTNDFAQQPNQIIRKQRIQDVNILKGKNSVTLDTDLRITINHEHKLQQRSQGQATSIRFKERNSFVIGWIRVDMTCVEIGDPNVPEVYEIELEVADSNFMLGYKDDQLSL